MVKNFNCPACGAGAEPDGSSSYVVCKYCSSSISVAEFFKEASSDTLSSLTEKGLDDEDLKKVSRIVEKAEFYLESSDFKKASVLFDEVLTIAPRHLPSRFNLALSELYSAEGSAIEKAKKAASLIENSASEHELIPDLIAMKESIAYNTASIGLRQTNAFETIELLDLSRAIVPLHEKRDALVTKFFDDVYQKQKAVFDRELKSKKRKYSPNRTTVDLILAGASFSKNLSNFGATILLFLDENKSSVNNKIEAHLSELREKVVRHCSENVQKIKFGVFGISTLDVDKKRLLIS